MLLENTVRRSDSDRNLLMTSLVTHLMVQKGELLSQGVQRIKQIRQRRRARTSARILKVTDEQDFQEDVGELDFLEDVEQGKQNEQHESGKKGDHMFDAVGIVEAGLFAVPRPAEEDEEKEGDSKECEWRVM
jgi:hypothetical protein